MIRLKDNNEILRATLRKCDKDPKEKNGLSVQKPAVSIKSVQKKFNGQFKMTLEPKKDIQKSR